MLSRHQAHITRRQLNGLPVEILGWLRSDRVMRRPTPLRAYAPKGSRPPEHGGEFAFGAPATWNVEQTMTVTDTCLDGKETAQAWESLHRIWPGGRPDRPRWTTAIIAGTVIRLVVEMLPAAGSTSSVEVPMVVGHRSHRRTT